jgi:hypothetical protein
MDKKSAKEKWPKPSNGALQYRPSVDNPICGRYRMATEIASHILYECVALADFRFCRSGKHYYGTNGL